MTFMHLQNIKATNSLLNLGNILVTCLVIEEKTQKFIFAMHSIPVPHAVGSGDDGEHPTDAAGAGPREAHGRAGP